MALGTAIVLAQALGLYALLAIRPASHKQTEPQESPHLTWLSLSAPASSSGGGTARDVVLPAPAQPGAISVPPLPPFALAPSTPAPNSDPTQAALRDYLACGALYENRMGPGERQRCEELQRKLLKGPLPPRKQTAEEKALTRQFAEDKAAQDMGLSAYPSKPGAMTHAQRGTTGIPDPTAGFIQNRATGLRKMLDPLAPENDLYSP